MYFVKKILKYAILAGILYSLLSYHFIIIGFSIKVLKKSEPTLSYIIYSTKGKSIEKILSEEMLRKHGIGELLVKEGMMSKEQLDMYKNKYNENY